MNFIRLTLTLVVFEFCALRLAIPIISGLTLTLVVFESRLPARFLIYASCLTLTLVVFESFRSGNVNKAMQKFNLNIGCI